LCDNLIKLLNGRIYLDENYHSGIPGSPGSRFVGCLPMESILSSSKAGSSQDLSGAKDSITECDKSRQKSFEELPETISVLFVDDDNVLRKLFCRAIKKAAPGWTVAEAASGEAALELIESAAGSSTPYNVVFMDQVRLLVCSLNSCCPQQNLTESHIVDSQYMASAEKQLLGTETVRELRLRGVDCTICGLSANNMENDFLRAGADTFLLKPFPCDREAMQRELTRICHSRSAA